MTWRLKTLTLLAALGCTSETLNRPASDQGDGNTGGGEADVAPPSEDAGPRGDAFPSDQRRLADGPASDAALPVDLPRPLPDVGLNDLAQPPDLSPDAPLPVSRAALRINEVDCHGRDWVEIYNASESELPSTAGFVLTDQPDDPRRHFALPEEGPWPPFAFRAYRQPLDVEVGLSFGIACGGDEITLLAPDGSVVDAVSPPEVAEAWTFGRLPDGTGDFVENTPTRSAPNQARAAFGGRLFDPFFPTAIDLEIDDAGLASLGVDPRLYVPSRLRLTDADGVEGPWLDVGVHLKGRLGSFRTLDRKSAFRVDVNLYDPEQTVDGLESLTLNNMVQDPSFVHEWSTYALMRDMGLAAPRIGYVWVRLNGEPYGLYAQIETYDDVYIDQYFDSSVHLYEGRYGQDLFAHETFNVEVDEGDPDDRSDFEALVAVLDAAPADGVMAATVDLIDWHQVLGVMAAEIYVGHWDGYAWTQNNWLMNFDGDGRLTLHPWGVDQTFREHMDMHGGNGRLMRACMADRACRETYDLRIVDVLDAVDRTALDEWIAGLWQGLRPLADMDPRKEFDIGTADWEVQATIDFMRLRRQLVGDAVACLLDRGDVDGDGVFCAEDCAPNDRSVYPGAVDVCADGIDQDCSGYADDGLDCRDCVPIERGGHPYFICPTARTYAQAIDHCAEVGATLVTINTADEDRFLFEQAMNNRRQSYRVGATDLRVEGVFEWSDGAPLTYSNFVDGQPDNGGGAEHCAAYVEDRLGWNDRSCDDTFGLICEAPCGRGLDADGDGHDACGDDCDDGDATVFGGQAEICGDQRDQDCDGRADEGPDGCDCVLRNAGGRQYRFCTRARTWDEARTHCQSLGLDLVIVNNARENTYLSTEASRIRGGSFWIGHGDLVSEGTFRGWDNVARPPDNAFWNGGEPNDWGGNEDCAELIGGQPLWNDLDCAAALPSICETLP